MTDSNAMQHAQQARSNELNQILGFNSSIASSFAYNHNYAYIVTVILSKIGMNRSQNNIEDKGALQNEISKGQTQFASMQQFMALLEGNTQWDSKNKDAYWPGGFQQSHNTDLKNFARAFGQFFWNSGSGGDTDPSTTTVDLNIDLRLPSAVGHYPAGTELIVNPTANEVMATLPSGQKVNATGTFGGILSKVDTYMQNVEKYVTGSSKRFSSGSTVPQYLVMAMANLQSNIDDAPDKFFTNCVEGSGSISSFAGAVNTNPLITSAQELYAKFAEAKGVNGSTTIAADIQALYNDPNGSTSLLWNDMAGIMDDWMKNKMADQSSSSGTAAPSGSTVLYPSGTQNTGAYLNAAENAIQEVITLLWAAGAPYTSALEQAMNDLKQSPPNKEGALSILTAIKNDISSEHGGIWNVINEQLNTAISDTENCPTAISDPGLFNEVQSALSMGASTYQSQTQQNSAAVQQETSTLTSYDQIGQSIITAVNKSEETIAGNLKST